jgi:CubicO group peptidase (beta-lactamase class C family)
MFNMTTFHRSFLNFTALGIFLVAIQQGYAQMETAPDLNALLKKTTQGTAVPAMAVLTIRKGRVSGSAASGVRSTDAPDPVAPDDVWHLGSNGKAMTATMIACLVDRHVLSWQTPLSKMLPELSGVMQPAYRDVTLRDLLSHQAGLQANIDIKALDAFRSDPRLMHELRLAYSRMALSQSPGYEPRRGNIYSNSGLVIAATIVERATGLSYEQLMKQEVFTPLHMSSAAFGPTRRGQPLGHGGGKPQTGPDADNAPVIAPVGEIHLTMADWAKFAIDQIAGEHGHGKLLKSETYKFLHEPGRAGSEFALGWLIAPTVAGVKGPFLTHAGSNTYWYAVIVLCPSSEAGVLVAANAGAETGVDAIEGKIVKELLPAVMSAR